MSRYHRPLSAQERHQHRAVFSEGPLGYRGSVVEDPRKAVRRAHGGARFRHYCSCGCVADELVRGAFHERGGWTLRIVYDAIYRAQLADLNLTNGIDPG